MHLATIHCRQATNHRRESLFYAKQERKQLLFLSHLKSMSTRGQLRGGQALFTLLKGHKHLKQLEPNFMALLTVSKESALTEAGNSTLLSSVFHRLAGNFCLCARVHHVSRHSSLTQLAQKFSACKISREW